MIVDLLILGTAGYFSWQAVKLGVQGVGWVALKGERGLILLGERIMLKAKKSIVCDALYDTILTLSTNRVLSFKDEAYVCEQIAKALDMPELLPRDVYRVWISARLKAKPNMAAFVRPNKPAWGEHTGKVYVPVPEKVEFQGTGNVVHSFLRKLAEKQAA